MKFFQTVMIVSTMSSSMVAAIDVSLAAGGAHTCALLDGTVKCWGNNEHKQLGRWGGGSDQATPQQVEGLSNVKAIAAGSAHTCALLGDGTVQCWGSNEHKQLGVVHPNFSPDPQQVEGLSDVKAIAAGTARTCALLGDGTVQCWGRRAMGHDDHATPLLTMDSSKAIAAGDKITCAIARDSEDGTVKCYGHMFCEGWGGLARNIGGLSNVKAIAVGEKHMCALLDGTVQCWGENEYNQVGVETGGECYKHTDLEPFIKFTNVKAIAAGEKHTCALLEDKTVKCWGDNEDKQLGVDTVDVDTADVDTATPQQVGVFPWSDRRLSNVKAISAGGSHTCALLEDKTVKCWGSNEHKQLGVENPLVTADPQEVFGLVSSRLTISGPDYDNLMLDNYETPYEKARDDYFYWLAELEKVAPPYKSSRDAFVRGTLIYIEKDIGHEGKFTALPKRQSDAAYRLNQKINSFAGHRRLEEKADWDGDDNKYWKDRHAPPAGYHYDQRAKHEQTQMGYRKDVADEKDKHAKHFSGTFEQNHPLYKAYTFYKGMTARYLSVTDQVRKAANIYDARREAFMSMTDALSSNIASGDFDIGDLMTVSTDDVRELIKEEGAKPLSKLYHDRRLSNSVSKESLTKLQLLQGSYWQSQSSEEKFNIVEQIQKILKQQGKKRLRSSRPREFFKSDEFIPVSTARLLKRSRHVLVEKLSRKKSGELVILQHLYWKTKNSEVKYKTAQSIEQLILK